MYVIELLVIKAVNNRTTKEHINNKTGEVRAK